jgi:hypothetical protein
MAPSCRIAGCHPDLTCVRGEVDRSECEHWCADAESGTTAPGAAETTDALGVPWNGIVAGTSDLAYLAARGRPRIVAVLGPRDAGKTTCLAVFYTLLLRSGHIGERLWCGSYTLTGWEGIARYTRWAPGRPPTFPPHTTSYATRQPGLLHLAVRDREQLRDVFLTDAPGEWFTEWARNEGSSAAEGARWIAQYADAFLLLVDTERLADPATRGEARNHFQLLLERVAQVTDGRQLLLVRSKCDIGLPDGIAAFLHERQADYAPDATWRTVQKDRPATFFDTVAEAIDLSLREHRSRKGLTFMAPTMAAADPFLSFRVQP